MRALTHSATSTLARTQHSTPARSGSETERRGCLLRGGAHYDKTERQTHIQTRTPLGNKGECQRYSNCAGFSLQFNTQTLIVVPLGGVETFSCRREELSIKKEACAQRGTSDCSYLSFLLVKKQNKTNDSHFFSRGKKERLFSHVWISVVLQMRKPGSYVWETQSEA